ncbi:hypothetical protein DNTS_026767 [Danionella cerebrum]|nr:hypothetical protein DNTS_026767 [Danionella translucida]
MGLGHWVVPPALLPENSRGPFPAKVVQIKSLQQLEMTYQINGEGADLDPKGVFIIDKSSGWISVTQSLDREKKASYRLTVHAKGTSMNVEEKPLEIFINVIDQNDNRPEFTQNPFNGSVTEAAGRGDVFMQVTATDADDPNTYNAEVWFSIISQDPPVPKMFGINNKTGEIFVQETGFDKEICSKYTLTIQAADLQGQGMSTIGSAIITITDSNDNAPQFEKSSYTVSVPEHKVGAVVARLPVTDEDEPGSPAWSTKYRIISGDENEFFNVSTGPSQLEGIITIVKPLDLEKNKQFVLSVIVENDDPFVGALPTATTTVTVNMKRYIRMPIFGNENYRMGEVTWLQLRQIRLSYLVPNGFTEDSSCTPGFDLEEFIFKVHRDHLPKGKQIGRVVFNNCDGRTRALFQSADKRFAVRTDGIVTLKRQVTLYEHHKMFAIHAWDSSGKKHTVSVRVVESPSDGLVLTFPKSAKRQKREWVTPDSSFPENSRGPFPAQVVQIKSDFVKETPMTYTITGEGVDVDPKGIFTIDQQGWIYVIQALDREKKASYKLTAHAKGTYMNVEEKPRELVINVIDQNDNRPEFVQNPFNGNVPEAAKNGDVFMQVTATDADDPKTYNAEVWYSIVSQDPPVPKPMMFGINEITGGIYVKEASLDRLVCSKYTLTIQAADLQGTGMSSTGSAVITVTDSNNNAPQFEKPSYTVSVPENKVGVVVARLPVTDEDEVGSPAWSTKYRIISGDKNGFFNVSTGPSQLEGIITTVKPLDFEKTRQYFLSVIVENDEPFVGALHTATTTVTVNVQDVNEPPEFIPKEKTISVAEDIPVGSDLVTFTATDPDTAKTQIITYKISSDPQNWLSITETGLVKVIKEMDREALVNKDGKYKVIVLAMDDEKPPATGTGTLVIDLQDVNDNRPYIVEKSFKTCNRDSTPVLLSIMDKDGDPFGPPFRVVPVGDTGKNWSATMNETSTGVFISMITKLDQDDYHLILNVYDKDGNAQDCTVKASVCDCAGDAVQCNEKLVAGMPLFGVLGILGGILALLLLVLLLLMFMRRSGKKEEPLLPDDDVRDTIYYYDEEGGGEDDQDFDLSVLHRGLDNRPDVFRNDVAPTFLPAPMYRPRPANPEEIGTFIDDNLKAADTDPTAPPYDSLLVFDYEGGGSEAGSLSSLNSDSSGPDQDYDFLHEWGPRFRKLADMYGGGED